MAIYSDLMGLGMAPLLAAKTGHAVTTGVQGTGTAQVGATKLLTSITVGVPITNQTAYVLPTIASGPATAKTYYFFNNAATAVTALIFPPTDGSTLNASTSASLSVAQNKGALFMLVSNVGGAANQWVSVLSN